MPPASRNSGLRFHLVAFTLATGAVACASQTDSEPSNADVTIAERYSVPASDETRSELGITTWGVDQVPGGIGKGTQNVVRGYDAAQRRVVEYAQSQPGPDVFVTTVKGGPSNATMTLRRNTSGTSDVLENTFANDALARQVLERIAADVAPPSEESAPTTLATRSLGLHTNDEPRLVRNCKVSLLQTAMSGAKLAAVCSIPVVRCPEAIPTAGETDGQCEGFDAVCPAGYTETASTSGAGWSERECYQTKSVGHDVHSPILGQCNPDDAPMPWPSKITQSTTDLQAISITHGQSTTSEKSVDVGAEFHKITLGFGYKESTTNSVAYTFEHTAQHMLSTESEATLTIPPHQMCVLEFVEDVASFTKVVVKSAVAKDQFPPSLIRAKDPPVSGTATVKNVITHTCMPGCHSVP